MPKHEPQTFTIGLISDTHGLLRPKALDLLRGSHAIIHGGDIGGPEILQRLAEIAPVTAVRGNNDTEAWAEALPLDATIQAGPFKIYILHSLSDLKIDLHAQGYAAVISGHSHKPGISIREGVHFINPGSAGRRRFSLPITVGRLIVDKDAMHAEILPCI